MICITTRGPTGQFLKHRSLLGSIGIQVLVAVSLVAIDRVASYVIAEAVEYGQKKYSEWISYKTAKMEAKIAEEMLTQEALHKEIRTQEG